MTTQLSELFEYQGTLYNILGMQGMSLIPIEHLTIKLRTDVQSTGLYRGYQGTYGIDDSNRLILKYAAAPHSRRRKVNQTVPVTGYILFSDEDDPWLLAINRLS